MSRIKGIIFDLDGVLCHTDEYHYLAWKVIADELSIPFDRTINNRLRGVSRMQSLRIIIEKYDRLLSEEELIMLAERKNDIYRKFLNRMSSSDLEENVREVLSTLRERFIKLAIGSSSKNARFILEKTGLTDCFDAVCDGNDITYSKPHPEVFHKAAERLKLEPSICLVVEDSSAGIEAAKRGGFMTAAIGAAASDGKADVSLKDLSSLLKIID